MQQNNLKYLITPIIALFIFVLLIFGAAYAYYTSNTNMNSSNYQVTLPIVTSLVCTKTDCSVTITPDQMTTGNVNSTTAKATKSCYVNCTCSGSQGATCNYNVLLSSNYGSVYTPSSSLGTSNEFTVKVTSPSGCTAQNSSSTATQINTQSGKVVSSCSLTVPSTGSVSANVAAEFKWYNLDLDQSSHISKTYKYYLSTGDDIPEMYKKVEYITSSGTQYIDTGYYWQNENIEIVLDAIVTGNSSSQSLFGNEEYITSSGNNRYFAGIPYGSNGTYSLYIGTGSVGSITIGTNTRFTLDIITTTSKNVRALLNGTQKITATYSGSVKTKPSTYISSNASYNVGNVFLFSNHNSNRGSNNNGTQIIGGMTVYSFKLYDNNVLVRDLIPAVRRTGSVAGMYDLVGGVFYTNLGTGSFTAGPDI